MSKEIYFRGYQKISLDVGDETDVFFQNDLKNGLPFIFRFNVSGIFIRFPDIDENLIFGDIGHVQKINKWGKDQLVSRSFC